MKAAPIVPNSLSVLCALLGILLCYELLWPVRNATFAVPTTPKLAPFVLPVEVSVPATRFAALDERPLFSSGRRPAPVEAPEAPKSALPPPVPEAWLVGVILAHDEKLALIRTGDGNLAQSLKVGDQIGSWTIKEISASQIMLGAGSFEHEMEIDTGKKHAPVTPVPTQAAP